MPISTAKYQPPEPAPAKPRKKSSGPNKTEMDYRRTFIDTKPAVSVKYEGITFNLEAGYRYTPDWVVTRPDGTVEIHEAKGPWESRDAHIRWAQAAQEWPQFRFYWGKRVKGEWKTETRNAEDGE